MDTRISSLSYIKVKLFDNDIKTKNTSKTYTNYETKGKPNYPPPPKKKKKNNNATLWYRTRLAKTQKWESQRTKPLGHRAVDISECYNLYRTSKPDKLVALKLTTTRNFVKLQKYAFLKQNGFMRIDKLPCHSSFFLS